MTTGDTRQAVAGDTGVAQNARLTALTGSVLLVLLFVEGLTLLQVHQLIVLHFVVGFALMAPLALKLGTTGYKIVRYYTGGPAYVAEGPPPTLRRLLGPAVIGLSLLLLGSGVALAVVGPGAGPWLFVHKASFVLWFGAMTLHVLMHLPRTAQSVVAEYLQGARGRLPGWGSRQLALVATLVVGVVLGALSLGLVHPWSALAIFGQ